MDEPVEIIAFQPAGLDHGIDDGAVARPVWASVSEGDFSSNDRRSDAAFGEVVVTSALGMADEA